MVNIDPIIHEDLGLATVVGVPCYRSQITYRGRSEICCVEKDLADLGGSQFRMSEDYAVMDHMEIPDNTPIVNSKHEYLGMYRHLPKPKSLLRRILETLGLGK